MDQAWEEGEAAVSKCCAVWGCKLLISSMRVLGSDNVDLMLFLPRAWRCNQLVGWCQRLPLYTYLHVLLLPLRVRGEWHFLGDSDIEETGAQMGTASLGGWKGADYHSANVNFSSSRLQHLWVVVKKKKKKELHNWSRATSFIAVKKHLYFRYTPNIYCVVHGSCSMETVLGVTMLIR